MQVTGTTPSLGDIVVARQPIFTRGRDVYGYELLYRAGSRAGFQIHDDRDATLAVLDASLLVMGLRQLTNGKRAFVNFPTDLLVEGYALLLPADLVVIELLESIEPSDAVLLACQRLRRQGYTLALDDFVWCPERERLVELAQIVKVDVLATAHDEQRRLRTVLPDQIQLLAEKVETEAQLDASVANGYAYFQGYFLARPVLSRGSMLSRTALGGLQLLAELQRPELDFDCLAQLISHDVTLSYRLLCYVNSAAVGLRRRVGSIREALLLLGARTIRLWATVAALGQTGSGQPAELVVASALRARFCEALGRTLGWADAVDDLFLIGLFSLLEALLRQPMEQILAKLATSDTVRTALLDQTGPAAGVYHLVVAYERAAWDEVTERCHRLALAEQQLPALYAEALDWANGVTALPAAGPG